LRKAITTIPPTIKTLKTTSKAIPHVGNLDLTVTQISSTRAVVDSSIGAAPSSPSSVVVEVYYPEGSSIMYVL